MCKALLLFLVFCLAPRICAQNKGVSGATVGNIEVNTAQSTAVIEVFNRSSQDITGFVLEIDVAYSDGRKDHSEFIEDCGAYHARQGLALHPAEAKRVLRQFVTPTKQSLINVEASVAAVVYLDQTAETTSDNALSRLVAARKDIMLSYQKSADAIRQVLADPNEKHPTGPALQRIRQQIAQAAVQEQHEGLHANRAYLTQVADELANAPMLAIEQRASEREMVGRVLADKQRKADLYTGYSHITKVQQHSLTAYK